MSKLSVTVWSDYVCPWCFIGLTELQSLEKEFEFEVQWMPYLLRPEAPEEGWELPDRIKKFIDDPNNPLTARAKKLGVTIKHRVQVPNSRRAHECTEYARSKGKIDPFHHHLIERYWSHGDDIHDWAVLENAATVAGLDPKEMRAEVEAGKWKKVMEDGIAAAQEIGVSAVPTFIVGNKFVIQGAQDAGVFRQAFQRLQSGKP
jgi:predicted DsbA family dithiol-disulfide isomerase